MEEVLDVTFKSPILYRLFRISSIIPSLKYSLSCSGLKSTKGNTAIDLSTLAIRVGDWVLPTFGNRKNKATEITNKRDIKLLLLNGFICSSAKGFPNEATEPILMNPIGLLSYNQAMSMAKGNKTMSNR